MRKSKKVLIAALAGSGLMFGSPTNAASVKFGDTDVSLGGFIKLDAIYSNFSDGAVGEGQANSNVRNFYVPHAIPTSDGSANDRSYLDFHAKETRLWLATSSEVEGYKVSTRVEMDFISGIVSGNDLVTNAYNPALRRAFIKINNWLIGQEWTTIQNLVALPETLDFVAWPTDGTVFGRHPMIRYSSGGWDIALEDPETSVQGGSALNDQNTIPDLVTRYSFGGKHSFSIGAVARQLRVNGQGTDIGLGISLAGRIALGERDNLKFTVTTGEGIGRYAGVGAIRDAQIDANGDLDAIGVTNGFIAYQHWWNAKWRSTFVASALLADHDTDLTGTAVQESSTTFSLNLVTSPIKNLLTGLELRHGTRELENGDDGDLDRLQFSVKYSF